MHRLHATLLNSKVHNQCTNWLTIDAICQIKVRPDSAFLPPRSRGMLHIMPFVLPLRFVTLLCCCASLRRFPASIRHDSMLRTAASAFRLASRLRFASLRLLVSADCVVKQNRITGCIDKHIPHVWLLMFLYFAIFVHPFTDTLFGRQATTASDLEHMQ